MLELPFESVSEIMQLVTDIEDLKDVIRSCGILCPATLGYECIMQDNLHDRVLVLCEEYVGMNILHCIKCGGSLNLVIQCLDLINRMPEYLALDTNPRNFLLKDSKIYFCDFVPPNPWSSLVTNKYNASLFYTTQATLRDWQNVYRYFSNEFRMKKFIYHLHLHGF